MDLLSRSPLLNLLACSLLWHGTLSSPSPASPVITPAPALHRRADFPPDFIGYSITGFSSDTWTCDLPYTYATDSVGYAGCCSPASCSIPRACSRNYLIYAGGVSSLCPSYCLTAIISTSSEAFLSTTLIDCATVSTTIYLLRSSLELESSTMDSTTTDSSTESITSDTSSSRATPPIPISTSTISPSPTPPTKKSSSNIGPIIGGAVGGAVGLIALALIGFILFRKHRKNQQAPYPPPGPGPQMAPQMAPGNAFVGVPNSPPPFYSNPASPATNDGYYTQKSGAMTGAWPMDRSVSPVPQAQAQVPQAQAQAPQQYTEYPHIAEAGGTQLPAKGPNATELE